MPDYMLTRRTKKKKTKIPRVGWGYGENGALTHDWWVCKLIPPLWKYVWQYILKLAHVYSMDPAISLLGIYPKEMCMYIYPIIIAHDWKLPNAY